MQPAPAIAGSRAAPVLSLGKRAKSIHLERVRAGPANTKSIRFKLRRVARALLKDIWSDRAMGHDGQGQVRAYRTVYCGRSPKGQQIQVYRADDGTRARFTGLQTCGSGWLCPVCCMGIAEHRRRELSAGLVWWIRSGAQAHLLTMTAPHTGATDLADFWARFDKARAAWNNSKTFKRIRIEAARIGQVCSAETTYGVNGWHTHLHMIYFCRRELTPRQVLDLQSEWVKQLLRAGLGDHSKVSDMLAHALDVRGGKDAADYITKYGREEMWGLSSELTREHTKEARGEHLTPFGLLALAADGELAPGGRDPAILFREYAAVTLGKRLMTWSPGLRSALQLGQQMTDETLADEPLPDEHCVASLDLDQWKTIIRANAEGEVLDYVAKICIDQDTAQADVNEFVAYLGRRKR